MTSEKIKFYVSGDGKPFLLIHPLGLDHHIWDFCLEDFAGNRSVFTYDLPGHGSTPVPNERYEISDLSDELYDSLQAQGIDKIDCLGLSIGGMILQDLASKHSELIDKLILVDTTYKYSTDWQKNWAMRANIARTEGLAGMLEQFLGAFFTADYLANENETTQYCRDSLLNINTEGYAKACEALSACNLEEQVHLIHAETLILCGDQDNPLFIDAAKWLYANISESNLEWLQGAQHLAPLEKKETFIRNVLDFLNS